MPQDTAVSSLLWPITYRDVDFQIIPENAFGVHMPVAELRLRLSDYLPAAILVGSALLYYFILVPVVFPSTRPSGKRDTEIRTRLRSYHNLALCIYSGIACFGTLYHLIRSGQHDYHSFLCQPVEGTWLRVLSVTFTLSKIWEWADTAFIVWLGSRKPKFLHIYHHTTTFWLFCIVMNQPGSEKAGMLFNGFVHFLMYSHYWRSWPKMFVPLITVLQIIQLLACWYVYAAGQWECPDASFSQPPRALTIEYLSAYATVPVFFIFFVKYFISRWVCPDKKKHI